MIVNSKQSNLGDNLFITPLLNALKNPVVRLHNDQNCQKIAPLFKYLAEVEFVDENHSFEVSKTKNGKHYTEQILEAHLGNCYKKICPIPKIKLSDDELNWGKLFISKYKNPIIFINDNSGSWDPGNYRAHYVRPGVEQINSAAQFFLSNGYDILQFGLNEDHWQDTPVSFTPIPNAEIIRGLDVRQLASCYAAIGKMVGGDTGDYHLMLAVGGKTATIIPKESLPYGYIYSDLLYRQDMWRDNNYRVSYFLKGQQNNQEIFNFLA